VNEPAQLAGKVRAIKERILQNRPHAR
jgi:hypothetical protein